MLQSECGYTPSEIREMTIFDIQRLTRHWRKHPPLRVLVQAVAASLGVKFDPPTADKAKQHMTADEFKRLVDMTGGGASLTAPNG